MGAGRTNELVLNQASVPTQMAVSLAGMHTQDPVSGEVDSGFGSLLRSMTPGLVIRTGLVSQAAHKEVLPGRIFGVTDEAGTTNLTIIYGGAPGAGEVKVEYDLSGTEPGIPTLTFNGAVTGYQVDKAELPKGYDEYFDAIAV